MADHWYVTDRGALLYGDDTGGITVAGLAAWKDCPERTAAIRALARWCDEAISSAAALVAEATEPPPERYEKFGDYDPERDVFYGDHEDLSPAGRAGMVPLFIRRPWSGSAPNPQGAGEPPSTWYEPTAEDAASFARIDRLIDQDRPNWHAPASAPDEPGDGQLRHLYRGLVSSEHRGLWTTSPSFRAAVDQLARLLPAMVDGLVISAIEADRRMEAHKQALMAMPPLDNEALRAIFDT